jgi:hypothetical protein
MKTTAQQPKRSGRIIITLIQPVMVYKLSQEQTYLLSIHIILYITFPTSSSVVPGSPSTKQLLCKNTTLVSKDVCCFIKCTCKTVPCRCVTMSLFSDFSGFLLFITKGPPFHYRLRFLIEYSNSPRFNGCFVHFSMQLGSCIARVRVLHVLISGVFL